MIKIYAIGAAAAIAGLLGATLYSTLGNRSDDVFAACRGSSIAGGTASIGGPFELVNGAGETVTDADVLTRPALVYFGYTFCPDVCPLDAARNAEALDLLAENDIDAMALFITIDPERDTPEVVSDYASYMHEDMIGLTGSPEQIAAASRAYKTYYKRQPADDEFYLVDHSTFTYLVLPETGFVEFFRRENTAEQIAEKTTCFVNAV